MRRWIVSVALAAIMVTGGCGASKASDGAAPTQSQTPTPKVTVASPAATPTVDSKLLAETNPCKLVHASDLNKAFAVRGQQAQFSPVDGTNPPVVSTYQERNCGYSGTVHGIYTDQPTDGTSVTIMITSQVDSADGGPAWKAQVEAGKQLGQYNPDAKLGHDAFFMENGHLLAHKGRVVIEVNAIDTDGILTNPIAEKLVKAALSRTDG